MEETMLTYQCVPVGPLESNCYILKDDATGALALVDCGVFNQHVREAIAEAGGDLRYVPLTHGHFDHVRGAVAAKEAYPSATICIGATDEAMLRHEKADMLLQDGDVIELGESRLRVIATPGHTPGGVCYLSGDLLFTGDTLFHENVGRADLPGGDWSILCASIKSLYALKGDYKVLPGHGPSSTLAHEREKNPFVRAN